MTNIHPSILVSFISDINTRHFPWVPAAKKMSLSSWQRSLLGGFRLLAVTRLRKLTYRYPPTQSTYVEWRESSLLRPTNVVSGKRKDTSWPATPPAARPRKRHQPPINKNPHMDVEKAWKAYMGCQRKVPTMHVGGARRTMVGNTWGRDGGNSFVNHRSRSPHSLHWKAFKKNNFEGFVNTIDRA